MSLCDNCFRPGHCCMMFELYLPDGSALIPDSSDHASEIMLLHSLPFRWIEGTRFTCPLLGADGRCTDYNNRPSLCADYVPGSDPLCIHHGCAEGGSD